MSEYGNCCLCGRNEFRKIPFAYSFKGRILQGCKCRECGLISILPRPTAEEIEEMYSDTYYTETNSETHHSQIDYFSKIKTIDYGSSVAFVEKYVKKGKFLEVGCADGTFLNELQKIGYDVQGVELSGFAAEHGKKVYGIDIINKAFDAASLSDELKTASFNGILMGDVLEHFTDPAEALRFASTLLASGGVLIAKIPGTLNLLSSRLAFVYFRLRGTQKIMTIPPYHLTEFTPASLKKIFLTCGFSKVKIFQQTKHPKTIPLRHSRLENFAKKALQYPNYLLTKCFGVFGDRMTIVAVR